MEGTPQCRPLKALSHWVCQGRCVHSCVGSIDQTQVLTSVNVCDRMQTASDMLLDFVLSCLEDQHRLVRMGQQQQARRVRLARDTEEAVQSPFLGFSPLFLLLADFYASDSLALSGRGSEQMVLTADQVLAWVGLMSEAVALQMSEGSGTSHPEDSLYQQDLNSAVSLLVQMAARVPQLVQQLPHSQAPYGVSFRQLADGAAERVRLGEAWHGGVSSPLGAVVGLEQIGAWTGLVCGYQMDAMGTNVVWVLTSSPRILVAGSNQELLQMLCTCRCGWACCVVPDLCLGGACLGLPGVCSWQIPMVLKGVMVQQLSHSTTVGACQSFGPCVALLSN